MKSWKVKFLESALLGVTTNTNNPDIVFSKCVNLAYKDMLTAGRYYASMFQYTKDEILELYINVIYYGDGCTGITAAAQHYFGKSPSELTDYECTLLAGVPNAPSIYAPTANPELCAQRQSWVLDGMVDAGYLSEAQAAAVLEEGEALAA